MDVSDLPHYPREGSRRGGPDAGPEWLVRPWAAVAGVVGWNALFATAVGAGLPLFPVGAVLSFVAAGGVVLAWVVPALRRAVFVPDAADRGAARSVAGSAVGMAALGVVLAFGPWTD